MGELRLFVFEPAAADARPHQCRVVLSVSVGTSPMDRSLTHEREGEFKHTAMAPERTNTRFSGDDRRGRTDGLYLGWLFHYFTRLNPTQQDYMAFKSRLATPAAPHATHSVDLHAHVRAPPANRLCPRSRSYALRENRSPVDQALNALRFCRHRPHLTRPPLQLLAR
jgi:hypothetical protein